MRTYILFTFAIFGIGGTQIYARNKLLYMQRLGWKTCMVTTEPGKEVLVKEMGQYIDGVFPQLMKNPYLYAPCKRKKILKRIFKYLQSYISDSSEIVIESNFMAITPWAELIAQKLNAKHFIFLIQEDYNIKSKKLLDFFSYKYDKEELAANTPQAISILFKGYRHINKGQSNFLSAYCANVVEDCESILTGRLSEADYNIGSIGRINKPFVLPMVRDIANYVRKYPDKKFNFILFGGSPASEDITAVMEVTKDIENLNTVITGALFPIPKCDIKKMDVCVSSAGAAWTSADTGVLTISIDANDFKPIGVLKVTTDKCIHRGDTTVIPLEKKLDEILIDKKYKGMSDEVEADYNTAFDRDVPFILKPRISFEYYKVSKLAPGIKARIANVLGHRITEILKKIKNL